MYTIPNIMYVRDGDYDALEENVAAQVEVVYQHFSQSLWTK